MYVVDLHEIWENGLSYCRIIRFNDKQQSKTKSNCVTTSKYKIWTFLPLFCIEQLKYFPNQYFLFISVLQVIYIKYPPHYNNVV